MNTTSIQKAVREAQVFIDRAKAALDEVEGSRYAGCYGLPPTAKTGALRRSSMELTRALSEMRRP